MKIIMMLALLSSTAFAGSFTKIDQGNATWNLSVKNRTGNVVLTRFSSGTESKGLTFDEQVKISSMLGWLSSIGTIANESLNIIAGSKLI